ncbi:hypothetical protein O0S10_01400 [Methanocorpusculum sp. MG]|uniref:Uncharacterized protein n=1 Tax=Methanocorpusculum petauri TaxID=3002863 RepID=A0ABT4IDR7_9EURY|nr:hypothetical protein [Methanocorpusculum petauri]MCZ0859881.1 hypothetical protein [Methanocorpusculum petauri]
MPSKCGYRDISTSADLLLRDVRMFKYWVKDHLPALIFKKFPARIILRGRRSTCRIVTVHKFTLAFVYSLFIQENIPVLRHILPRSKKGRAEKIEHDLLFWKIPDTVDPKNPEQWPTEEYRKNVVDVTTYSCSREAVEVLLNLPELCTLEAIFSRKKAVLPTPFPPKKRSFWMSAIFSGKTELFSIPNPPGES